MRLVLASCLLVGACATSPAVSVQPGDDMTLTDVDGDVGCEGGSINLPAGQNINGGIDATDCVLKITGVVNGSITATGGIVHVIASPSVNGELSVTGAAEVAVFESQVNGGADIEDSMSVTVEDSGFNGKGEIVDAGSAAVTGNRFNGSLTISAARSCRESGNTTNGSVSVTDCH